MKTFSFRKKSDCKILKWIIQDSWVQVEILNGEDKGSRRPASVVETTIDKKIFDSDVSGKGLDKFLKTLPKIVLEKEI